jgi:hypothetical protein
MGGWQAIDIGGNTSSNIYANGTDVWMLYKLKNDAGEQKNVAAQHLDILQARIIVLSYILSGLSHQSSYTIV